MSRFSLSLSKSFYFLHPALSIDRAAAAVGAVGVVAVFAASPWACSPSACCLLSVVFLQALPVLV